MEGSQSGKCAWRIASKAETSRGQWKPSISEYTCTRVNGGRYSIQKRYVARAARLTMVLVRSVGVVKDHRRLFLRATGPAARAGRCERDTRRRRDVEYRAYHRGGSIGWVPAR